MWRALCVCRTRRRAPPRAERQRRHQATPDRLKPAVAAQIKAPPSRPISPLSHSLPASSHAPTKKSSHAAIRAELGARARARSSAASPTPRTPPSFPPQPRAPVAPLVVAVLPPQRQPCHPLSAAVTRGHLRFTSPRPVSAPPSASMTPEVVRGARGTRSPPRVAAVASPSSAARACPLSLVLHFSPAHYLLGHVKLVF